MPGGLKTDAVLIYYKQTFPGVCGELLYIK